ncbi:MAG TPA: tyrosine-type recombinase/integrase [Actinomycetota bacterium]|nr:tyrosine-type recombinase/integrase [Actinomycetota bacterium]
MRTPRGTWWAPSIVRSSLLRADPLLVHLAPGRRRAEVTLHDLRHYYASLLIQHGERVEVAQRRLGHRSSVETLDTYSHLWPDSRGRTREAVDQVPGRPADATEKAATRGMCATSAPAGQRRGNRPG